MTNVKLPGHPVRTGQARRGFPGTQWRAESEQRKYLFNCAPSCLPAGRDPTYPALAGRGTCRPKLKDQIRSKVEMTEKKIIRPLDI